MSRLCVAIEDILHAAGYRTERAGGEVNAFIPVHRTVGSEVIVDSWTPIEVRSVNEAFALIDSKA